MYKEKHTMKITNITAKLQQLAITHFSIVALVVVGAIGLSPVVSAAQTTGSASCNTAQGVNIVTGKDCAQPDKVASNLEGQGGIFATVANILLFLVGAVAVIMLIIGGLRYVTSNGDQNAVTGAKNTIMYAIIGIIVAFLAYAGVNFVITQLSVGTGGTSN